MLKKIIALSTLAAVFGLGVTVPSVQAQVSEETPDFTGKAPADFADEETMKEVASGGVPMGRWKEGLHVRRNLAAALAEECGELVSPVPRKSSQTKCALRSWARRPMLRPWTDEHVHLCGTRQW